MLFVRLLQEHVSRLFLSLGLSYTIAYDDHVQ